MPLNRQKDAELNTEETFRLFADTAAELTEVNSGTEAFTCSARDSQSGLPVEGAAIEAGKNQEASARADNMM